MDTNKDEKWKKFCFCKRKSLERDLQILGFVDRLVEQIWEEVCLFASINITWHCVTCIGIAKFRDQSILEDYNKNHVLTNLQHNFLGSWMAIFYLHRIIGGMKSKTSLSVLRSWFLWNPLVWWKGLPWSNPMIPWFTEL